MGVFWRTTFWKEVFLLAMRIPLGKIPSDGKESSLWNIHLEKEGVGGRLLGLLLSVHQGASESERWVLICTKNKPSLVRVEIWLMVWTVVII